jgi:hypothetical protein
MDPLRPLFFFFFFFLLAKYVWANICQSHGTRSQGGDQGVKEESGGGKEKESERT